MYSIFNFLFMFVNILTNETLFVKCYQTIHETTYSTVPLMFWLEFQVIIQYFIFNIKPSGTML